MPWGGWGCFGVLRVRPERASGVWLLKSNFVICITKIVSGCARFNATKNRHSKPKSRAPGKGGFVGVVGQLVLRWGASVPTSGRGLLKSKFRYLHYENRQRARLLQRHRNRGKILKSRGVIGKTTQARTGALQGPIPAPGQLPGWGWGSKRRGSGVLWSQGSTHARSRARGVQSVRLRTIPKSRKRTF